MRGPLVRLCQSHSQAFRQRPSGAAQSRFKDSATGAPWGETDAEFTLTRQEFIEEHPEAAVGEVAGE